MSKAIIFQCQDSKCKPESKASQLADHLEKLGIAIKGDLAAVMKNPEQLNQISNNKLIFVNDCPSACIRMFIEKKNLINSIYLNFCDPLHQNLISRLFQSGESLLSEWEELVFQKNVSAIGR